MSAKINIFLLAGNRLFREALAKILASKSDFCVSGAAACSSEAISQIERSECDVLLIDPAKGEAYDISFVHSVSRTTPDAKIMVIDMVEDDTIFIKAVRAGVAGYLLQNASAADVVAAVRAVHQGEAVCPPRLCKMLFSHVASDADGSSKFRGKSPATLTRREQQLMPMIGQGLTNKEIASKLNLSEQTVKNHVHRILQRTGAPDRYAAVELAHDRNLLLLA